MVINQENISSSLNSLVSKQISQDDPLWLGDKAVGKCDISANVIENAVLLQA